MSRTQVSSIAAQLGMPPVAADWQGIDAVLPMLERMRREGAVVLVKLDGERTGDEDNGPYTVLISGRPLAGETIRTDAHLLEEALAYVICRYAARVWSVSMLL